MKTFTVVAVCLCGCREIGHWHLRATNARSAAKKFRDSQDPDWPLRALKTLPGKWKIPAE